MTLFAWGAGNHGQLLNGLDDHSSPVNVSLKDRIEILACGGSHLLLISKDGLRSAGNNDEGQLGIDNKKDASTDFSELQLVFEGHFGNINDAKCGWSHSLVLIDQADGQKQLFGFGSNEFGQLGLSVAKTSIPMPIPMNSAVKIISVSCGLRHSAFIQENGQLWMFGENRFGQCSEASLEPVSFPKCVTTAGIVKSVVLGARHTMFVTDLDEIFAFGENRFGQCAQDPSTVTPLNRTLPNGKTKVVRDVIIEPKKVDTCKGTNIVLRCGWNFSLVWCSGLGHDSVVMFGRNNYGQLGTGAPSPFEWKPQILDASKFLGGVRQIECGSEHTMILDHGSQLWTFGWNEHGQLGLGDEKDRDTPTLVSSLSGQQIDRISCGYGFCFAWNEMKTE